MSLSFDFPLGRPGRQGGPQVQAERRAAIQDSDSWQLESPGKGDRECRHDGQRKGGNQGQLGRKGPPNCDRDPIQ